jgi:predicted MPP superfamily phosphohydrolase
MGCRQGDHRIEGPTRRTFLKWGTAAAVAVAFGEAGRGLVEAYQRPVIEEFDLLLPGLDGLTKPLTLIQVTDFHFGQFLGNSDLQGLVDLLNTLDGDMVIITGDIFHSPVTPIGDAPDILRTLRPRSFGNLAVMGNHDFYAGEARSVDAMQAGGLKLLRNQWMTLEEKGTRIYLGGIDDPMANWIWGAKFPGFMSFMEKAPGGRGARILLSHRPSVLPVAADAGIDFVMAGHIHGGQIVVPWPGVKGGLSLAGIASEYTRGWYQAGKCRMYLNRGVGLTFVPWRINCPPEIAVMNLKPSPAHDSSVLKTRTVTTGSDREKT